MGALSLAAPPILNLQPLKSELNFKVAWLLQTLPIQNGQLVQKGTTIAAIDPFEYRQKLDQAETQFSIIHL